MRSMWLSLPLVVGLVSMPSRAVAQDDDELETVEDEIVLGKAANRRYPDPLPRRRKKGKVVLKKGDYEARYRYEVEATRPLIPLADHIQRCVNMQRMISGEFHDRLDFIIEPSGALKTFDVRRMTDQLKACLMPHVLPIKFPPFVGQPSYTLYVGVGSTACRLGRKTKPKPVDVYPLDSDVAIKAYRLALFWQLSPWTDAISDCAEWVDQSMGTGYEVKAQLKVKPLGRVDRFLLQVRGKFAKEAFRRAAGCIMPFVRAMRAPPHKGSDPFVYTTGSRTASWER